jgi:hypothetical protein
MGLLDDAIREHLELKRRRGADPGEVAREQREVLDPAAPAEPMPAGAYPEGSGDGVQELSPPAAQLPDEVVAEAAPGPGFSGGGQETAELDMQTVLDEEHAAAPADSLPADHGSPVNPEAFVEEESLEWEGFSGPQRPAPQDGGLGYQEPAVAGDPQEPPRYPAEGTEVHAEIPGQERLSFE